MICVMQLMKNLFKNFVNDIKVEEEVMEEEEADQKMIKIPTITFID